MRWVLLSLSLACGCATTSPYTCQTYCDHAASLSCDFAAPTPRGDRCVDWCSNAQILRPWNLQCKSTADTCEEISRCEL